MMDAPSLARQLGGHRAGTCWMARCPAHDDRNPSLAIRDHDGRVLVHCHAGCAQADVVNALRARGLWEQAELTTAPTARYIQAVYDYSDEHGELLYQVVRYHPKAFSQRRPDGRGGWTWRKGQRQVLYRLREVLEAPIVFLVEGEKDVETLREWGFVATTNAGGAKAPWLPEYTAALAGREVILIPDNDAPGRHRVATIARALLGHAARVIIVTLDDGSKDITEWFHRGHAELELIAMVEGEEVTR